MIKIITKVSVLDITKAERDRYNQVLKEGGSERVFELSFTAETVADALRMYSGILGTISID